MGGLIGCVVSVLFGLGFLIFGIMFINYNSKIQAYMIAGQDSNALNLHASRMFSGSASVMSMLFGLCGCGLTMFGI